jgi:hypothetical protein
MAYTPLFEAEDIANAAIDVAAGSLVGVAGQAETIGLILAIVIVLSLVVVLISGIFGMFGTFAMNTQMFGQK